MTDIARAFEWIAVAVLILAFSLAVVAVTRDLLRFVAASITYRRGRRIFGRGLLISLEVLIAADLIRTVAVEPTITNVGVLGLIVLVRTLLVFALDVEMDGVLPWRKRAARLDRRRTVRRTPRPHERGILRTWRPPGVIWLLRSCGRSSKSPALLAWSSVKA